MFLSSILYLAILQMDWLSARKSVEISRETIYVTSLLPSFFIYQLQLVLLNAFVDTNKKETRTFSVLTDGFKFRYRSVNRALSREAWLDKNVNRVV